MNTYAAIQRAEAHGLTLTAEGNDLRVSGAVTVEVGMILTANKSRILKLLQIRNRGRHDGALSQGVCMTAQRAATMAEGKHIGYTGDDSTAYRDGFRDGAANGVCNLTIDEARDSCQFGVCEAWKAAGNEVMQDGGAVRQAITKAAQVCRECEEVAA